MKYVTVIASIAVAAAALSASRGASAPGPLVIDRTLLCTTTPNGGVREIEVRANAGFRQGATWKNLAFAVVATGGTRSAATILDDSLAWVAAGKYDHSANLSPTSGLVATNVTRFGTWALNRTVCTPATTRVPLSPEGLRDATPDALGLSFDCATPPRVLVRVRAIARSTFTRFRERAFEKTKGSLRAAYVAVRTQAGKQLAYAAVLESGKARLFTDRSCVED